MGDYECHCAEATATVRGAPRRWASPVAFGRMAENSGGDGLRERLTRQGEDALGRLAQDLLENPLVNGAIARAFEAREKAAQAQEVAFGALNIPSASDLERLTRRVRSLSQRLEGIEDGVDRLDERLASIQGTGALDERLSAIEAHLDTITKGLAAQGKDAPTVSPAQRQAPGGGASARKQPAAAGKRAPRST
jgi:hypothetical protein